MLLYLFCRNEEEMKSLKKRANHNETEKRRIKNISNAIEEMRNILDVENN